MANTIGPKTQPAVFEGEFISLTQTTPSGEPVHRTLVADATAVTASGLIANADLKLQSLISGRGSNKASSGDIGIG
ncbi:MAG: hypothetical protein Q7S00_01455 [bacterium]|nr:hypothetical protein [bacterium]